MAATAQIEIRRTEKWGSCRVDRQLVPARADSKLNQVHAATSEVFRDKVPDESQNMYSAKSFVHKLQTYIAGLPGPHSYFYKLRDL